MRILRKLFHIPPAIASTLIVTSLASVTAVPGFWLTRELDAKYDPKAKASWSTSSKSIPEIRMKDVSYEDVIKYVSNVSQTNITMSPATHQAFKEHRPLISLRFRNVKVEKVLKYIVELDNTKTTIHYRHEGNDSIQLLTADELPALTQTIHYSFDDLIRSYHYDEYSSHPEYYEESGIQFARLINDTCTSRGFPASKVFAEYDPATRKIRVSCLPEEHLKIEDLLVRLHRHAVDVPLVQKLMELP